MGSYRFILSGGGTGGHIYPAIAIANELKLRYPDAHFLFVGAKGRMEMEKVPQAGYAIEGLWITGIQRKVSVKNLMFPFKLISSLIKARSIIGSFKPHVAIGTGGFASGPLLQVAGWSGIPYILQEQNSFAGITNKILKNAAERICVAYDGMEKFFPSQKIVKTGNPVRSDLLNIGHTQDAARTHFGLAGDRPTLLVLGGSLGAARINKLILGALPFLKKCGLQVLWQCGKGYISSYAEHSGDGVKVLAYINEMDKAYAAADIIVSRAGAGAVSELCLVGKPTIFIPSPVVAEDHQTKNALAMVSAEAALMLKETELDGFEEMLAALVADKDQQLQLGRNCKAMALPNATRDICDEIERILERKE